MAELKMTLAFCEEDRARLDALIALKERPTIKPEPHHDAAPAAQEPKKAEPVKVSDPEEKPAERPTTATAAPDRRTVKSLAVKKIQAGHRDEVKALIAEYGAEKIDLVPEDRLADFTAELEKIGG